MISRGLEVLERKAFLAIHEAREVYALTDATHSRSISKRKSRAVRARDWARAEALCEAVYCLSDDPTPYAAWYRLEALVDGAAPCCAYCTALAEMIDTAHAAVAA